MYLEEGNREYRRQGVWNAIYFFTEGIQVNCKDVRLNAKLYSNRATAHYKMGKTLCDLKILQFCNLKPFCSLYSRFLFPKIIQSTVRKIILEIIICHFFHILCEDNPLIICLLCFNQMCYFSTVKSSITQATTIRNLKKRAQLVFNKQVSANRTRPKTTDKQLFT